MNQGQADSRVIFLARLSGYRLLLTSTEAVLSLGRRAEPTKSEQSGRARRLESTLRMRLLASNANPQVEGLDRLPGTTNYFLGSDPKRWRTTIPSYARIRFREVYPGVDLVYHGAGRQLEYDFVLAPGADPGTIRLAFEGASKIGVDGRGDLALSTGGGDMVMRKPVVWQETKGGKKEIPGRYAINSSNEVAFEVSGYDASAPLVIDPVLIYSTSLGNGVATAGHGIAVDSDGNAYATGETVSTNFPITQGAFQRTLRGGTSDEGDVFVAKLNAAGTALVYSTYLGGTGADAGTGIAVDAAGNAYVTGVTVSTDFPATAGAFQTASGGAVSAFIAKLNATGTALVYSTYLGGKGGAAAASIAVDPAGGAYLTGIAKAGFPTTPEAFQPTFGGGGPFGEGDAFVTKLDPTGRALAYSTYLGGRGADEGLAIALDSTGNAYVTGWTQSTDFPTTPGAFKTLGLNVGSGPSDAAYAFATKLNPGGTALVYSTYLASMFDLTALGIAVDGAGSAYVAGNVTYFSRDFVTTPGAFQTAFGDGRADAFVMKLNATGTALVYSTYLGGNGEDSAQCIAVDPAGNAYVTGYTESTNFPGTSGALDTSSCGGFVTVLNTTGTALVYSVSLCGVSGIAVDPSGNAYVIGRASIVKIGPQSPATAPSFPAAGVVNAASFTPGGVSPGELITIFGTAFGPPVLTTLQLSGFLLGRVDTVLGGTRVLFDGVPAPMVYVVQNQLSAIVPYSVAGKSSTQVQIEYGFAKSSPVTLQVVPASPGIFTLNASGKGQGAILNQDFSVNSPTNPAAIGSIVAIYATGEGQTKPPGTDGALATSVFPMPLLPVSVRIGGIPAEVQYAGAAPTLVAGVLQVNAKVPAGVAPGSAAPVTITVGTAASQPNVFLTIAGDPQPTVTVSPTTLSFRFEAGRTSPPAQSLSVTSTLRSVRFTAVASTRSGGNWLSLNPSGGATPTTLSASVNPSGLAAGSYDGLIQITAPDAFGSPQIVPVALLVASVSAAVRQYTIATLAGNGVRDSRGDGGPAANAAVTYPSAVALDNAGNVYIVEGIRTDRLRKIAAGTRIITTVAGGGAGPDGGPAVGAFLNQAGGVALDNAGNIYITEVGGHRVRKVTIATGIISTIAGTGVAGYSGDGGLATRAQLRAPGDVGLDSAGNLYIADIDNHRIRRVDAGTGVITTVAGTGIAGYSGDGGLATSAQLHFPNSLAVDSAGNLYIGDSNNHRVRRITAATQIITTVAGSGTEGSGGDGGPAASAQISEPFVGVDATGGLYIADSHNQRVRLVDTVSGIIITIAGTGVSGYSGDGGPAINARLNEPFGVAVDRVGNVYVADSGNSRVRLLTPVPAQP